MVLWSPNPPMPYSVLHNTNEGDIMNQLAHFNSEIQGIPCKIKVTHYQPEEPMVWDGLMEDSSPGAPSEVEFHVLDTKGNPAPWLERKIDDKDLERIESAANDWYRGE